MSQKEGECWVKILEQTLFHQVYRELQNVFFEPLAPPLAPLQLASPAKHENCSVWESPLELFLSAGLVVLSPLGQCPLWSTWNSGSKLNFHCMLTSSVSTAGWCLCCWSSRRSRASWPSSRTQTRWVVGCTWWIGLWIEDYFHLYSCIYCICILIFCGEDSRYAYCIKSKPFVVFSILK